MRCQREVFVQLATVALLIAATRSAATDDILPAAPRPTSRPAFPAADEALLDEVERATFLYFWNEVGQPLPLVKDRMKGPVSSSAAIGFQLAALPIGVERGWITRDAGAARAGTVLAGLRARADNRKWGVLLHYPDLNTGGMAHAGYELVASTVDHALFLAGAMTAAAYFGGEVADLAERWLAETNWRAFAVGPGGFLSMGWRPRSPEDLGGAGEFLKWHWYLASDEERLIYFLTAGCGEPKHALEPALYYRLERHIERHADLPPYVVSYPGALFTYFFAHCYIDYGMLGADEPQRFGIAGPRVDWCENTRRAALTQRQRGIELAHQCRTLSADRWGLSACAARDGYLVPETEPNLANRDEWFEGTVAPYAALSCLPFVPEESLAALRAFRTLRRTSDGRFVQSADPSAGELFVWRDPARGGYGFVDSFNLDQDYAHDDYVGIDQGPLLLALENARTGLVWKLFMQHPVARRAVERLKLAPVATTRPR